MTVVTTVLHPENDPSVDLHPETDAGQVTDFLNKTYPVNSIFMSVDSTSPASLFGGTWTRIQDGFLLSAGYNSIPNGQTGGQRNITIAPENLPSSAVGFFRNTSGSTSPSDPTQISSGGNSVPDNGYGLCSRTRANTYYGTTIGYGETINIMNPYLAVYMWKRVA